MAVDVLPIGLAVGTTVLWALMQILSGVATRDNSMALFSGISFIIATASIGAYAMLTGGMNFSNPWLVLIAAVGGVLDSILGFAFYLAAMKKIEIHVVTSLTNTAPLWAVIMAVLFLGEAARLEVFAAVILVVAGSFLMISGGKKGVHSLRNQGALLAIAGGIVWGITETLPTKYCLNNGMSPFTYLFVMTAAACAGWLLVLLANWLRGIQIKHTRRGLSLTLYGGFLGIALSWILWLSALSLEDASILAPVRGLVVPFGFALSIVIVKEHPTKKAFLGLLLIIAGLTLVSLVAS